MNKKIRSYSLCLLVWLPVILFIPSEPGEAQVTTQITVDGSAGTSVTQAGRTFNIDGGAIRGANQFHSFDRFSVGTGDTASFNGPSHIQNILSRVTGGARSDIDGTLRSTIDGANLFLLNPNGVIFGPNASLDVSGAFHVGTGDYLRFQDGAEFHADLSKNSVLTVAPPEAFGFWGPHPGGIAINQSKLQVKDKNTLSVVGGELQISGGKLSAPDGRVNLVSVGSAAEVSTADAGIIHTDSVNDLGNVTLSEATVNSGKVVIRGGRLHLIGTTLETTQSEATVQINIQSDIHLDTGTKITASGPSGGTIHVESETGTAWVAGNLEAKGTGSLGGEVRILGKRVGLDEGAIVDVSGKSGGGTALIGGDFQGKNPDIKNATATYVDPGASIHADASTSGHGGKVIVWADDTTRAFGTLTARGGVDGGDGGLIETSGNHLEVSGINVDASARKGQPGTWLLDPLDVEIIEGSTTTNKLDPNGPFYKPSKTGAKIQNTDIVTNLEKGNNVTISTKNTTGPEEGNITVNAHVLPEIVHDKDIVPNDKIPTLKLEAAGDIRVDGKVIRGRINLILNAQDKLDIRNRGTVSSHTLGTGDAGIVQVKAKSLSLDNHSLISSDTAGSGNGGAVEVTATDRLNIRNGSEIGSLTDDTGNAGSVKVTVAGTLFMTADTLPVDNDDFSRIRSDTRDSGDAGMVDVMAGTLILDNGSRVSSDVVEHTNKDRHGNAGMVKVTVTGNLIVDRESRIRSDTRGLGNAGAVEVNVSGDLVVDRGGRISSDVINQPNDDSGRDFQDPIGDAGTVTVKARTVILTNSGATEFEAGRIRSATQGIGDAGAVTVNADTLTINNGGFISTDTRTESIGNAGNVEVRVNQLLISNGSITSTGIEANDAGSITIVGREGGNVVAVDATNGSISTSSTGTGAGGSIRIDASEIGLKGANISATVNNVPNGTGPNEGLGNISLTSPNLLLTDSTVTAASTGDRNAGNITLTGNTIQLQNSLITGESTASGNAGDITLTGDTIRLQQNSQVTTDAAEAKLGGNITFHSGFLIDLIDSSIESSVLGGAETEGGNINLNSRYVVLQNSDLLTTAQQGNGGMISILASDAFLRDFLSTIDVSSVAGLSGIIDIQSPITNLTGTLAPLPEDFLSAADRLREPCDAVYREGQTNTFAHPETIALQPGTVLPSPPLYTTGQNGQTKDGSLDNGTTFSSAAQFSLTSNSPRTWANWTCR
jgi:filamentous hemagglutinin family protein